MKSSREIALKWSGQKESTELSGSLAGLVIILTNYRLIGGKHARSLWY